MTRKDDHNSWLKLFLNKKMMPSSLPSFKGLILLTQRKSEWVTIICHLNMWLQCTTTVVCAIKDESTAFWWSVNLAFLSLSQQVQVRYSLPPQVQSQCRLLWRNWKLHHLANRYLFMWLLWYHPYLQPSCCLLFCWWWYSGAGDVRVSFCIDVICFISRKIFAWLVWNVHVGRVAFKNRPRLSEA